MAEIHFRFIITFIFRPAAMRNTNRARPANDLPTYALHPVAGGPCFFWTLPPELRQHVFEYAYHRKDRYRIQTRGQWLQRASAKRPLYSWRKNHIRMFLADAFGEQCPYPPFPDSELMQLAVSQQYFAEAVEAFFRMRCWKFSHQNELRAFLHAEKPEYLRHIRAVDVTFGKRSDSLGWIKLNDCCPQMSELTVRFDVASAAGGRDAPTYLWSSEQIAQTSVVKMALACPKLRHFRMFTANTNADFRELWEENLQRVEGYVRERMVESAAEMPRITYLG